jgi:hypothetical protein
MAIGVEEITQVIPEPVKWAMRNPLKESSRPYERAQRFHDFYEESPYRGSDYKGNIKAGWRMWEHYLSMVRQADWWMIPPSARGIGLPWNVTMLESYQDASLSLGIPPTSDVIPDEPKETEAEATARRVANHLAYERERLAALKAFSR